MKTPTKWVRANFGSMYQKLDPPEVSPSGVMVWKSRRSRPGDVIAMWGSGRRMRLTAVDEAAFTVTGDYEPAWRWWVRTRLLAALKQCEQWVCRI